MKIEDVNLTSLWLENEKRNNEINTNLVNALKQKEKELNDTKKNKCSEFKMYGYKGLYKKMKKAYDELLEKYNIQNEYYQNALSNCFDLDNELTSLKMEIESNKKIETIKNWDFEKHLTGDDFVLIDKLNEIITYINESEYRNK